MAKRASVDPASGGETVPPDGGQGAQRIGRGSLRSLIFRVLTAASDFFVVVVTARGLGASGRGLYSLAALTASIAVTFLGGTGTALAAEVAHQRASLGRLHAASLAISVLGGTVVAIILAFGTLLVNQDAQVLLAAAVATPVLILNLLQTGLYVARDRLKPAHWAYFGKSFVPLVAMAVTVIVAPGDVYLVLWVWAISQAVVPLITLAFQAREARPRFRGLWPLVKSLLGRGSKVSVANGIALLNYRVDLIVVAALAPLADVGRYSVAIAVAESITIFSRAVVTGAQPHIISATVSEASRLTVRTIRHSVLLLVVAGLLLLASTPLLLTPVFGEQFEGIWLPLACILPGILALGGVTEMVLPFLLIRLERSREYLLAAVGAMLINLALAVALVPAIGLVGAAISTSVSYACGAIYLVTRFRALGDSVRVRDLIPGRSDVRDYLNLGRSLLQGLRGRRSSAPAQP
jgi:O-antigen/teichoic acid export membrane protein